MPLHAAGAGAVGGAKQPSCHGGSRLWQVFPFFLPSLRRLSPLSPSLLVMGSAQDAADFQLESTCRLGDGKPPSDLTTDFHALFRNVFASCQPDEAVYHVCNAELFQECYHFTIPCAALASHGDSKCL